MLGQICFKPFGKLTPREHDAPSAALAFQADICAQARNDPLVRATRMLFSETEVVVEAKVR